MPDDDQLRIDYTRPHGPGLNGVLFRPLPFLANPHLQTILAVYVKRGRLPGRTLRHRVPLPDGDCLVLHENCPTSWRPGDPAAVIVHGLTGSHRSGGVTVQAEQLARRGVRVFRLDQRGAGAALTLCRKLYTAGNSEDLRAALAVVSGQAPGSPLLVVGTSLGGNVALKLAGEAAQRPVPGLARVAALNPPIDLAASTAMIARRDNRLYEWHFVSNLVGDVNRLSQHWGVAPPAFPPGMSMQQFDDLYTAPRNGFASAAEYYERCSSMSFAPRSPVPTLILSSRDDPFVAAEPIAALHGIGNVETVIAQHGGHTGYLSRHGVGWAEKKIADWLTHCDSSPKHQ